jgi:ABC-type dipeptide/oligopeptide/nickel transport system permease component
VLLAKKPAGRALEIVPAVVFGTPLFLFAVVVVLGAVALGIPFHKSALLASGCMAVAPGTFIGVVLSDALLAERARPYFVTALAQGLSPRDALVRHALPNALPALLDAVSPIAASLLAGSFVCENFFQLKGFGLVYLEAARIADPGVVVVATTVFASLLLVVSLIVELVRLAVDPKTRRALEADA